MRGMTTLDVLLDRLAGLRLVVETERETQAAIAEKLEWSGVAFEREARLSLKDRVDFLVGTIGIEVKVGGQKRAILRQLERYATHEAIEMLVLVTNVAMGLPSRIGGKPLHVVSIGRGWL